MAFTLFPLYLMTGAMIGFGVYLFGGVLFPELPIRKLRIGFRWLSIATILIPLGYFGVYLLAKKRDPDAPEIETSISLIPAIWLFFVLLGAVIGLIFALRRRGRS